MIKKHAAISYGQHPDFQQTSIHYFLQSPSWTTAKIESFYFDNYAIRNQFLDGIGSESFQSILATMSDYDATNNTSIYNIR